MNRMVKRLMVVLMSVLMVLGTVTTPVQAKGRGNGGKGNGNWPWPGGWGWGWQQPEPEPEPEEEAVVEEETPQEPAVEEAVPSEEESQGSEEENEYIESSEEYPEKHLAGTSSNDEVAVNIDAPEGALPANAELEVSKIDNAEVEAQVASVTTGEAEDMLALDISFTTGEPNGEVSVTVTADIIAENTGKEFTLVHIKNNGEVAQYYIRDNHPAIILRDDWEKVQRRLDDYECSS